MSSNLRSKYFQRRWSHIQHSWNLPVIYYSASRLQYQGKNGAFNCLWRISAHVAFRSEKWLTTTCFVTLITSVQIWECCYVLNERVYNNLILFSNSVCPNKNEKLSLFNWNWCINFWSDFGLWKGPYWKSLDSLFIYDILNFTSISALYYRLGYITPSYWSD